MIQTRHPKLICMGILLGALSLNHDVQAAVHHASNNHASVHPSRWILRGLFSTKYRRKKTPTRFLATIPRVEEDYSYSTHRIMSLDKEPLFPQQQQQQQQESTTFQPTSSMPAWKRLFTRPTQSVWPIFSQSGLSKVPYMDNNISDKSNEAAIGTLHDAQNGSSLVNTKKHHVNDSVVDEFMSNHTTNHMSDNSHAKQTGDALEKSPSIDILDLFPAMALPSSISISSIQTRLVSILQHPQLPKWTWTGLQLGLAVYLLNVVAKAVGEVMGELLSTDSSPHLLNVEQVKQILASLDTDSGDYAKTSSLLQQQPTLQHLTTTLLASGMPLRSLENSGNSIEQVLLSLTRAEASILQQCLWIPTKESSFSNIAGLQSIKHSLLDFVWMLKSHASSTRHNPYSHFMEQLPGILLYGPPGCGKTLLVKALAASTQVPCLVVTPSVLLRKYVGETNLQVRALFSLAQKLSPCIVCIDELDGLFRERSLNEHEVSRDLKTEFLQWWDGIASDGRILIVGATNRPFEVDSAVLRRMPQSYFVGLPNYEARKQLLSSLLKSIPTSSDLKLHPLAADTEGYTPSDLHQVVRMAVTAGPLRESRFSLNYRPLSMKDVAQARSIVSPTPMTPGYRAALTEYTQQQQQRNYSGMHAANNSNNNNQNPWDSFYNAGTIHASHGSVLPEWSKDSGVQSVDDEEDGEHSYEHDESDSDNEDDDDDL